MLHQVSNRVGAIAYALLQLARNEGNCLSLIESKPPCEPLLCKKPCLRNMGERMDEFERESISCLMQEKLVVFPGRDAHDEDLFLTRSCAVLDGGRPTRAERRPLGQDALGCMSPER